MRDYKSSSMNIKETASRKKEMEVKPVRTNFKAMPEFIPKKNKMCGFSHIHCLSSFSL